MPILDPSIQYFLLNDDYKPTSNDNCYSFFLRCLINASRNIFQNHSTIEASIQFKNDLRTAISLLNTEFGCDFSIEKDFENQMINDYYRYLFDKIKRPDKLEDIKKSIGIYKMCTDKFNTKLYQPTIFFSDYHSWYLSDTPIAILCINSKKYSILEDEIKNKIYQFIKLEIDLLKAAGLTLVLCYNGLSNTKSFLYKIIEDDQFSELHINIREKKFLNEYLKFMKDRFISKHISLKGFIYLYTIFPEEYSVVWILLNYFKEIPRTEVISFSKKPNKALIKINFLQIDPFPYYKTGFKCKYLRIYLSFVPIYDKNQKKNVKQLFTNKISGLSQCYISPSSFLFLKSKQVNALFEDESHHHSYCLIDFEDIHLVRSDLFVNDTLSLIPMEEKMHKSIDFILSKVSDKCNQSNEIKKSYIHHISLKNYLKCIRRIAYAYTHYMRSKKEAKYKNFSIRKQQIYTVLEACMSFFNDNKEVSNKKSSSGVVYEIKTGEGKSCIICLIAAVLAIKNITVHIASSNIKLCIRDYLDSLEFFKLINLKSAVLLHKNELPFYEEKNLNIDQSNEFKKNYPEKFFSDELFNNPSRMNFSICGVDNDNNESERANIIFSTFVNFECFYLHLMDNCPGYIEKYFNGCGLLVDEVDSILIDEITTGTIVSREIESNAKEILSYVYKNRKDKSAADIYQYIKETFDFNEDDFSENDVEQMFKEIDLVNNKKFQDGKKYIIETFTVKNNQRIKNFIKKTVQNVMDISNIAKDKIKSVLKNSFSTDESDNQNDDDDESDDDIDNLDTSKFKQFKRIIPFDYDHKGIPEPNKEFSGFIQQFISLKENRSDLIFKNISINYLYISHPIFSKLYKHIFGLTGTVGDKNDKTILFQQYNLITKNVPRHKPNLRVDLPMIVCSGISERNEKIVNDVLKFHEKGNPVLVIFLDFNEIDDVERIIYSMKNDDVIINVFNGKNDLIKPDFIAGNKGSITFGTNICGRGTDIKCSSSYPLHVIVSYYSSNLRVMEQAFGRTARNGQIGTCRCICLKSELCQSSSINPNKVENIINEADLKSKKQREFIDNYKNERPWIFEFEIKKQSYKATEYLDKLKELRNSRINVNRIVAYRFKFPVFMSYNTFLKIQAQKIFSIFNCPNCKYTWRIFQRYIREMILQSWSLMIKKFDQKYPIDDNKQDRESFILYNKKLTEEIEKLNESIRLYLPKNESIDMVSTFYHICNYVRFLYEDDILNTFGESKKIYKRFFGDTKCTCIQLGFKPYSLLSNSGARITKENVDETNFIKDPELSYERKRPDNTFSLLSITERIDDIFNLIFQKISLFLGDNFFLKFFVRRTLAGCEFGICLDMVLVNEKLDLKQNLLIDKNPLLVATIYLWSIYPLLAGILICTLVYIASMHKEIFEYISCFPAKIAQKVAKKSIMVFLNNFIPQAGEFIFEKILDYLNKCLEKQIEKLDKIDQEAKEIIDNLRYLFESGENFKESVCDLLGGSFSLPSIFGLDFGQFLNGPLLLKISINLILLLACFLIIFIKHKRRVEYSKSDSKEFDSSYNNNNKQETSDKLASISERKEKNVKMKVHLKSDIDSSKSKEFNSLVDNFINSENFEYIPSYMKIADKKTVDKKSKFKKATKSDEYRFEKIEHDEYKLNLADIINYKFDTNECYHNPSKNYCLKVYFNISKELFDLISFFSSCKHPIFAPFIGYVLSCDKSFLLFKSIPKSKRNINSNYLSNSGNKKFSSLEDGLIFAYRIANAFEYLENHNLFIQNFNPNYVLLIDNLPFIFGLNLGNDKENINYMAPEFSKGSNCFSNKSNVFSLGMMLYVMSVSFFCDINQFLIKESDFKTILGDKSIFNPSFGENWCNLVFQCLDADQNKRISFSEICNNIEKNNKYLNSEILTNTIDKLKTFRPSFKLNK